MPIPFIVIAGAAVAGIGGATGIGKGIKAAIDTNDAKRINESANEIIETSKKEINSSRENSNYAIRKLGEKKVWILNKSITPFIESFEKIHNIELKDSEGLNEINKLSIDRQDLKELKELTITASSLATGVAGGAIGGALTAFGAYGAATTFGMASTGAALSTLSGAAATNATLAFFGGGSLAAGGLGMAGGAAVLGGLVAGPALAIMGFVVGAKANSIKDEAYSNLAEANKFKESAKTIQVLCKGIRIRATMFERLLIKLDSIFSPMIYRLDEIINTKGVDYRTYSPEEKMVVTGCLSLAKAIKTVLDTSILTEEGKLTDESKKVAVSTQKYIEQY